jgi:hypothetical protein
MEKEINAILLPEYPTQLQSLTVLKKQQMQHLKQLPWQQPTQVPAQTASTTNFFWAEFNPYPANVEYRVSS